MDQEAAYQLRSTALILISMVKTSHDSMPLNIDLGYASILVELPPKFQTLTTRSRFRYRVQRQGPKSRSGAELLRGLGFLQSETIDPAGHGRWLGRGLVTNPT